jgi:hypothetical protein
MIPVSISAAHAVQTSINYTFTSASGDLMARSLSDVFAGGATITLLNVVADPDEANDVNVIPNFSDNGNLVLGAWPSSKGFTYTYFKNDTWGTSVSGVLAQTARRVRMTKDKNAIVVSAQNSPFIHGYQFSTSGHGTKFTNPASLPTVGGGVGLGVSHTGETVLIGGGTTPYMECYVFSSSTGFGTKRSNTGTATANVQNFDFHPSGAYLAISQDATPWIAVYNYTDASGIGTKIANPGTLPSGSTFGEVVKFSPTGNTIALGTEATPYYHAYPWTGSAFGTKYSNPSTITNTVGQDLEWNSTSTAIITNNGSVHQFTEGSGFGARTAGAISTTTPGIGYKPTTKV